MTDSRREVIRAVIAEKEGEYDDEGDRWLARPDPDTAYLAVDALTDAVLVALGEEQEYEHLGWVANDERDPIAEHLHADLYCVEIPPNDLPNPLEVFVKRSAS